MIPTLSHRFFPRAVANAAILQQYQNQLCKHKVAKRSANQALFIMGAPSNNINPLFTTITVTLGLDRYVYKTAGIRPISATLRQTCLTTVMDQLYCSNHLLLIVIYLLKIRNEYIFLRHKEVPNLSHWSRRQVFQRDLVDLEQYYTKFWRKNIKLSLCLLTKSEQ